MKHLNKLYSAVVFFLLFYLTSVHMPHLDDFITCPFSHPSPLSPCAMMHTRHTSDQVNTVAK